MISKHLNDIIKTDIESLISNGVREGRDIDYKRQLIINTDGEKKEVLADISSFANAGGGDLVIGIEEADGVPVKADGIKGDMDALKLQIESCIRDSIQPRIPGIKIKTIEGFLNGPVLVIRIPKSWNGPHIVSFKNSSRFFTRNSAGKYQMDVTEIKSAFLKSEEIPEKIRRFRDDRLGKIIAGETPVKLCEASRIVLHLLPINSFTNEIGLNITDIEKHSAKLGPPSVSVWNQRINLDGFVTFAGNCMKKDSLSYCQIYRSGKIESVYIGANSVSEPGIVPCIPSKYYEEKTIKAVNSYLEVLKSLEISCPIAVFISMTGTLGVTMGFDSSRMFYRDPTPIDRDILILPDILIQDYSTVADFYGIAKTLRPIFDSVWNACGFPRSFNYEENGEWRKE